MADTGGSIGSSVQSHARTRGPFDGKLYVFQATATLPDFEHFYDLTNNRYTTSQYGVWRLLRMVDDFTLALNEGDRTVRKENYKGKDVPVEGFYPERAPSVKFKLGEQFDPYSLQLGLMTATPIAAINSKWSDEFAMSMQGTKKFPLPFEFNVTSQITNDVTAVGGTPAATGGTVPAGTHYYTVSPVWGTAEAPYAATAESVGVVTTGATSIVTVQWTHAPAVQPDYYRIYRGTAVGTYAASSLVATVPGFMHAAVDLGPLSAGTPSIVVVTPFIVKSLDGVTTYVVNTDYVVDFASGMISRTAASSIGEGELVRIIMTGGLAPGVVLPFDQGRFKSLHLPLMFVGQQSGTLVGESDVVRIILDSVDWAKGMDEIVPRNSFDDAGLPFELPCDLNPHTARFGEIGIFDQAIDDFNIITLGT